MRNLSRNEIPVFVVAKATFVDVVDGDGNYTGESTNTFGTPVATYMSLYPTDGSVKSQPFGIESSFDMIGTSNNVELDELDYIFLTTPVQPYDKTYDYIVSKKLTSLNSISYGLKKKV
jgi:hypothetical protein